MNKFRRATALALCVCLVAITAHAGDKEEAEKHFLAGVSLQKVDDFDAAIAAFNTSLRLYPTKGALFNLSNCLRAVHRYGEALKALEKLERDHGSELDGPMRSAVEGQLEELRNLTASLVVQVEQSGAEVWLDGALLGRSPLPEALYVSPGGHDIEVRLEGFEPAKVRVELHSRQAFTTQITLAKAVAPPPTPPAPVPPPKVEPPATPPASPKPQERGALTTAGWITAGTGAALLAGGAVTGVWALTLDGDLKGECVDGHCPAGRSGDIDRLGTLTTTTNILLGVGVALTAGGITMLLVDQPRSQEQPPTALDVSVGPGQFGATVRQRF